MLSILRKIKRNLIFLFLWLRAKLNIYRYGRNGVIFLLGTPWHGNIGDQAIALAEEEFLNDNCKKKIIEIPSQYILWYLKKWINIIGTSSILIHGGGFIGTLWPEEDKMIKKMVVYLTREMLELILLQENIFFLLILMIIYLKKQLK